MNIDLALVSHGIGKKRTAAEAQLSPISPVGEFVTAYWSPNTNTVTSKRQRLKSKILKCLRRSEFLSSIPVDGHWAVLSSGDIKNSSSFGDNDITGTNVTYDSTAFNASSDRNNERAPRKHRFRKWLNEKSSRIDQGGLNLTVRDIFAAVVEEAAKIASIRKNTKAVARSVAVTAAAHARANAVLFKFSISHASATNVIKQACRDVLSVSPVPKWRNADYVKLFSLYHYRLSSVDSFVYKFCSPFSLEQSISKDEFNDFTTESFIQERHNKDELKGDSPPVCQQVETAKNEEIGEKGDDFGTFSFIYENISEYDTPSKTSSPDHQIDSCEEEDNKSSKKFKKWMDLLMTRIDDFGEASDVVHTVGDGIRGGKNEIESANDSVSTSFGRNSSEFVQESCFNPCLLDDSWLDALLPHIEEGSPLSYEAVEGKPATTLIRRPDIRLCFVNPAGGSNSTLESDSEMITKEIQGNIGEDTDEDKTFQNTVSKEAADIQDSSFSSCENASGNFSKAYLRIEALNSQFDQINSQIEQIVSSAGLEEEARKDFLEGDSCQSISVDSPSGSFTALENEWKISNIHGQALEECVSKQNRLSETITRPGGQVKQGCIMQGEMIYPEQNGSILGVDAKEEISQIHELVSLIDSAMVPSEKQQSKMRCQASSNSDMRNFIDGGKEGGYLIHDSCEEPTVLKTKNLASSESPLPFKDKTDSGGSQVHDLLARIDSAIIGLESSA